MPTPDKIDQLYDALKADGAVTKSREHFRHYLQSEQNARQLYGSLKADGAVTSATYEDFAGKLGLQHSKQDVAVQSVKNQVQEKRPTTTPTTKRSQGGNIPTWQQQMSMNVGNSVRQTIQTVNQRQKNVGEYSRQRMQRPLKQQRVQLGRKSKGVLTTPSDSKNLEQGRNEYNPETGKFEPTYITSVGNKYNDSGVANMEQRQIDDALERELRPVEAELRDAYAERDRLSRQMNGRYETLDDAKPTVSFGAGQAFTGSAMKTLSDDEFNQLSAAYDENDKRIKLLEAKRRDAGFFGGLTDVIFDPRTWTNGLNDLKNTLTMLSYAKGGKKTDSGEQMLESRNKREIAEATHGDDLSWWYGVGKMAGEMLPFAIQIGATGGFSGIANKGIGATTSLASKVANPILSKSLKYTGVVASEMAAGLAVANTAGVGNTLSAVGERYLGHVDTDEQGNYSFAGGENGMTAFVKGELGQMLEYGTEGLGKHLHLGSRVLKGLDKIGASKITNFFNKIGGSRYGKEVGEFLGSVGIQGYPEEVMEEEINILMNSILVGDNKLSDLWDSKTQKDIWGGMLLSLGFMGALPTSLYGGKRGYDAYKYHKLNNKVKDADRVAASRLTDNVWPPLRERIDNTPNNTMQDVIEEICNSESLAQEEKEAALNYIRHSMVFRGYNMGTVANMKDVAASGEITDEQADAYSADKSYTLGYNTTEPKDMQDLIHNMDYQRERISNFANSDDMAILDGNPTEAFDAIRSNNQWSEEQKEIATEYVNARNSHVAMLQRINDDADALAKESVERMKQMQHADSSLHSATLKETDKNGQGKQVYVVDGNVQMMTDGSMVDPATSDKSVVIYDPATGEKKMIDPTADTGIHSLDDVVTAADFEAGIERSREEYVQSRIDEAKGTVRLVPGQQLVLPTGEEAVVVATDGDNATVTLGDGSQTNVSLAELQRIKDEEAMADYRQRHGINEEQTEQPYGADLQERSQGSDMDGAPADFTPDMELVVRDEDGNEKPAMVMGRVRYENGKLVPDDNGNIIEYYMDGEVMHEHESVLADKVVSRVLSTEVGNGVTDEDINEREGDEWGESGESVQSVQSGESEESEESNEEIRAIERIPFVTDEKTGEAVLNKKGKRQYLWHEASVDDTAAAIAEINDGSLVDARDTAQAMIEKSQKGLENAQKVKVTGDDPIEIAENRAAVKQGIEVARNIVEHWKNVRHRINSKISEESARIAAEAEAQKSAEEKAEEERERERQRQIVEERERNRIAEEIERDKKKRSKEYAPLVNARKEFADDDAAMSVLEDTEPRDLDEWVSSFITPHSMMWNDESMDGRIVRGLKSELGLSAKDMQSYMNLLAPSNSGGKPFDTVVHDIWENLPSAIKQAYTDHDVRNSLIGLFGEGSSTRMRNLIAERRIAEARDMHDAMLRAEEEALEEWAEAFHLTANERETFYEYMQSSVEIDDETTSVLADIFGEAYGLSENDNNNNNTEIYGKQDKGGDFLDREPFEGGAPKESIGGKKEVSGQSSGETTGDDDINGSESEGTFVEDATPVVTDNVAGRAEIENAVQSALAVAEQETNTEPTEAQKEAGNYKKGHFKIDGFDITVENPKGSVRRGTDANGKQWEQEMQNTYGYIRGTEGVDGDHIDVFFSEDPSQGNVFVVDQVNEDGSFDEHKVMYGFSDIESARKAYLSNYEDGWQGLGAITPVSKEEFKKWIDSSHRKTKPFAEYATVKTQDDVQTKKPTETEDFARQDLKELEDFQKNTDTTGRTAIDENRYDAEELFAPLQLDGHEYQRDAALQHSTETLTNDTQAKQKATEAVLAALNKAGIEVVRVTDEQLQAMLANKVVTVRFMQTPRGTIYGWTIGGKIYLTEAGLNPETPIHEYTHLWADAMMIKNKQGWNSIKSLLKGTPLWNEVIDDPNYSDIRDNEAAVASEALSRISGRKNAKKMEAEAQKVIDEAKGVFEKADAISLLHKMKKVLKQFWQWVGRSVFGIKDFKNIDEVTDRVLYDLVNKTKFTEKEDKEEIAKRDKLYLEAVERGDMETAQRMVNETAAQNGYIPNSEYQGSSAFNGAAPYGNGYFLTKEERKEAFENDEFEGDTNLDDYVNGGIDPMNLDFLTNDNSYRHSDDTRKEAIENLRDVFKNKRQTIKMYRSVPSSIKEGSFRNGDWVTPSYAYAVENARIHGWGNKYRIIEQEVPLSEVWFDGNDIAEFGYGNEDDFINDKDYLYSNTKNNRKLPDAVTYDNKGNVIPLSKRFSKAKSDPRFQIADEPSSIYQDKYGTSIKYRSLFDEMSLRDEHEASSISKHSEQAQTTDDATTPSDIRMRKLKKGETCHVERVYEETKQFDFTGKDKVESAEDVAYIFRQLESAAAENSFLVLVKDGKPTVIHLGVGTYTATVAPYEQAFVAYKSLNPEQVYFVHNHPSGALKASNEDRTILGRIKRAFGEDVVQQGIIINTTSGNYGEYDTINTEGEFPEAKVKMSANNGNEVPIKVYKFSKQVFASDWNPETAFKIISSNSVAEFVSSHRLGKHKKMSFLVVSNNSDVVANVFLPWTKLSDIQHNKDAGDLLAGYVHQCGGARGILYGNYDYTRDDDKILWALQKRMREFNAPLMDALHVEHSAFEQGIIGEPDNTIYDGFDTLKEITGARGYRNNSAYLEGVTENGEKWVIRVSDHPIKESNLDEYNQEDADYVLSLVVDDDFDPRRQRQDAFHDESRGHYQYVLTSDDVFSYADHFRRIVERFKKEGGEEIFSDVVYREGWGSAAEAKHVMHEDANLVRTHAEQLGEKLNTPINIIEDMESITHSNAAVQERRRKSKGWYNAATGEVVVVLPNNRNVEDVTATIMHETVAHKGLRELVGEDNYGEFLDETYKYLRDDLKKDVDAAAGRAFVDDAVKNGEHAKSYEYYRRTATDELFGRMAEKPFEEFSEGERTLWQKLKHTVRRLLDKFLTTLELPKWFELGDNELRYMLWRSKERLERGKEHPIDLARDIVKREELGLTDEARYNMGDKSPDFHSVIDEIFSNAGFDKTAHQREHYDLGETPTWMKHIGIAGERFTLSFKNIKTHLGKDEDHNLTAREWHELPSALQKPFLVTTYGNEAGKFRLYTSIKVGNKFAVVGVDVVSVNKGKYVPMLELNRIKTVFGRDRYVVENGERILAWDKEITPEQEALLRGHNFREYPTIQELSAAKIVNNSETTSVEGQKVDESTDLYRDTDETEDIWKDQSMGLQERTTAAATRLANKHQDNKTLRNEAMRAIGGNLADLRKAMSLQRQFDMSTVKRVYDLARVLMNNGYLNGLNQQEVKRLFAAVKNSVGHNDIEGDVQKIIDIMVDNQLKHAEDTLHKLETIKGSKVDARGVEVQGQLDPTGAHIMKAFKDVRGWDMADIENAIDDIVQRMDSSDNAVADEAAIEYVGAQLALEYARNIRGSKVEEKELRDQIKQAHDESSERDRKTDAYRQHIASLHEAIRQNKIERVQAYYDLVGRITGSLRESIANAQEFKEAEKQRIREIQHNANSDMEGRPSNEHYKPKFMGKFVNNAFVSYLFAPLSTFDQMLRLIGNKSANGEGYLYNRFMRGWVDARQKEIKGVREKYGILDAKAAELFGGKVKTWGDLIRRVGKLPKGTVSFWNGGEMQEHELTQGNLMYIYMVNKMLDGRMKLRKMGITEENVADIEAVLDPRLMELADWLQNEFLVDTRNEYNETHKRMFGASMAAIENYFPLKILSNARADKAEDLDAPDKGDGISTATGSIIKRRRNSLALDITNADALHVILDHVAQMEHWNAYVEFNRDLNTLRTYKRFRNQVENMTTIYGSGKKLWKKFNDVCQMASGTYRPPRAMLDEAAVNFAKSVTAAKVSFRLFTALKQFLSAPAYLPEARADYLLADIVNPVGAWKWSMEHLPIFSERWHSRMSGDPRLLKSDMDWKMWRTRIMQLASRAGMSPNAFVDALTVSIGAHAMYKTRLGQYLRDGYEQSEAEHRAIQDAEILYNETQQSSEGAFTSTIQVDRSWLSVVFTVFRNSSMAYQRQLHDALRNMKRNLTPGQRAKSVEFMKKQLMRDGIDEAKAEASAKRKFRSQLLKDTIRIATFGYIMQLAWNLGAYLPYLLFGDDDDEKQKMWSDVFTHTMFGSLEGLTGGDVLSQAGNILLSGEGNPAYVSKDMPLTSDITSILKKLGGNQRMEAFTDIANLLVQLGIGLNPQSITDGVLGIMDACGNDPALAHEATICIFRILQVPQSQIDKIYFDEVGLSGSDVSQYTPTQLAERYARFKIKRGYLVTPWLWDDEGLVEKKKDGAMKKIKERVEHLGSDEVNEAYLQHEGAYKGIDMQVKAIKKDMKDGKIDYVKAAQMMSAVQSDREAFATYQAFGQMDGMLNKIAKMYIDSKTQEEAALCQKAMLDYKSAMVKVLDASDAESRTQAMQNLSGVMQDFSNKYVPMQQPNR